MQFHITKYLQLLQFLNLSSLLTRLPYFDATRFLDGPSSTQKCIDSHILYTNSKKKTITLRILC